MKTHLGFALACVFASTVVVHAGSPVASPDKNPVAIADSAWSSTLLGAGIKTSDNYTDGNIFLTIPVWSTIGLDGRLGGDYLFIEPYSSVGTGGEVAASLGLSYRHLFSNEPVSALQKKGSAKFMEEGWFLGGNLFLDMLDTQHRNSFWQLGVGLEAGTRYVEVRGNYYIPLTSEKLAERNVTTQQFSSSSSQLQQSGTSTNGGNPYATGNTIVQDANLSTTAITTIRTTTVRTVTELFEKGMEGWDAEMAVLVPWVDQWMDVKLIGGYFSFDNQPFGPQDFGTGHVHGFKAGVEVRPVPALVLSGTWFEDKRFTGSNWLLGLQLQVPLDKSWRDAFTMRRRHLVEHLAEPVHRQNDAVKVGNNEEHHSTSSTSVKRVTRVISQGPGHLVLKDDIIFVNNGAAVGNGIQTGNDTTGDGTAEKPKAVIQTGANIAQANSNSTARVWNVYTQGTVAGYTENVGASAGSVNFIGSGQLIAGKNGKSFGTGPAPVVNGGFGASGIGYFGVNGYTIKGDNVSGFGAFVSNVGSTHFVGNTIQNTGDDGIFVSTNGSNVGTVFITRNAITSAGLNGVDLQTFNSSQLNATLAGNDFHGAAKDYVHTESHDSSTLTAAQTGNQFHSATGDAMHAQSFDTSTTKFTATGNSIADQLGNGIHLTSNGGSGFPNAVITGNTINRSILNAVFVEVKNTTANTGITVDASGNFIGSLSPAVNGTVSGDGIRVVNSSATGSLSATVNNNKIYHIAPSGAGNGIYGENDGTGAFHLIADHNTINGTSASGIFVTDPDIAGNMSATLTNNNISNTGGSLIAGVAGIHLDSSNGGVFVAQVTGNTLTNPHGDGILAMASNTVSGGISLTATNNIISGDGTSTGTQNGIDVLLSNSALLTLSSFTGNNISHTWLDGINVQTQDTSSIPSLTISQNTLTNAGGTGAGSDAIHLHSANSSTLKATVTGNTITSPGDNGIAASTADNSQMTITLGTNGITSAFSNGITISNRGTSMLSATVHDNTIDGAGTDGIQIDSRNGSTLTGSITNNTIKNISEDGIFIKSINTSTLTFTLFDKNSVTSYGNHGLDLQELDSSTFNLNGTLDAAHSNSVGAAPATFFRLNTAGSPAGSFFLNGVQVNLPATVP